MSLRMGSWVEVTVPDSRLLNVQPEIAAAVKLIGGATMTNARGLYVRKDTGALDDEAVTVIRFDMNLQSELVDQYMSAIRAIVDRLLVLGEESVLRRRFYNGGGGYNSELIFQ
ncbi:hypothetical protein pXoo2106_10 [Xanthomonas phage pXoo2106]|uniref:Uncharacterized protein n=3 Tax=Pradovirus TaxID=1985733 RepID=A0AAE8YJ33_9CAUD|nr:hypothetical protein HOR91_gp10 [Xanthomonas phage phi Xc10]ASZ72009.1 hypothetical protein [Xanthomonas phage phi Xc10]UGL61192.1 hypothetical protein [Xanthomonas phage MUD8-T1]UGL62992.1 hypothetical protein [Xanthomonas phage R3-22-T1]UUR56213.1 hypothetical protein pXoo2106_10 [Xanthomonas phage pXoo2106]